MINKIKIGIPRALLYFRYIDLWKTFFEELGYEIFISPQTNKSILQDGVNNSIDESCLSAKIYMGHVHYLIDKVDYILAPRIVSYGKNEVVCTKFNAMYDIVHNTYRGIKLLDYNVDVLENKSEFIAYLRMGKVLGSNYISSLRAYLKGKKIQELAEAEKGKEQDKLLSTDKLKLLIVSHAYNIYDGLIGKPIIKYLESLEVIPIYADRASKALTSQKSELISNTLYWTYNKELLGAIEYYKDRVDGIIFITTFPCGPDSLVNELCIRKIKTIPITNIVLDELQGETGLQTRIESFVDILSEKKKRRDTGNG